MAPICGTWGTLGTNVHPTGRRDQAEIFPARVAGPRPGTCGPALARGPLRSSGAFEGVARLYAGRQHRSQHHPFAPSDRSLSMRARFSCTALLALTAFAFAGHVAWASPQKPVRKP